MLNNEKEYIVYIHTNTINNKKYIGITCQKENQRFRNGKGYKSSKHFNSAIHKYGWDKFTTEIIHSKLTEKEAKELEIKLIEEFNTRNPNYGYNITPGGEGYSGEDNPWYGHHHDEKTKQAIRERMAGRKVSDKTKKRQSEALKGRTFSEETIEKMKTSQKNRSKRLGENHPLKKYGFVGSGEKNPMYGKHLTEEQIRKMVSHKKYKGKDNGNAKKVICIETNEIFDTLNEAAESKKCLASTISSVVHGKKKTAGGYHWQLYNEGE